MAAFLTERVAKVLWGHADSALGHPMSTSVPQGTNSAPTLFDALADDLPEAWLQYADDALCVAQGKTEEECINGLRGINTGSFATAAVSSATNTG